MSILIKMEMPKNCGECPCCENTFYQCNINGARFFKVRDAYEKRHPDCPFIELPPHGDLIDRDALMKDGWLNLHKEVMRMGGYAIHELPLTNPSIPVVIEKENC